MKIYHAYNKSIAGYRIFNEPADQCRIKEVMRFYPCARGISFSVYKALSEAKRAAILCGSAGRQLVLILAYCIMPTHLHLLLADLAANERGLSEYMRLIEDSYSRYYNIRHKRKGPLWQSRFKKTLIETDEQLLHVSRYVHLNPVTAGLVARPEEWAASSYHEYTGSIAPGAGMCAFKEFIPMPSDEYAQFVMEGIDDQIERARIKAMLKDKDD